MRRADRLLKIVQILRRHDKPTTAREIAIELEVVPRTIYRDVAALQASRVPIDGEAGVGYVLRPGYDLPPLMFDTGEVEALVLGLSMVIERGDAELSRSAEDALAKIRAVSLGEIDDKIRKAKLIVPHSLEDGVSFGPYVPLIRDAIRESSKLMISYANAEQVTTQRIIWPLGLYLYSHVTMLCAWCEKRHDFRAFRSERIIECTSLNDRYDGKNGALMTKFLEGFKGEDATTSS